MLSSLDRLPDDPAALKAIILAQQEEVARLTASARAYEALVQALKIRIARLQRQKFGPSSEKIEREDRTASADPRGSRGGYGRRPAHGEGGMTPKLAGGASSPLRTLARQAPGLPTTRRATVSCSIQAIRCPERALRLRLIGEDVIQKILDFISAKLVKVAETAPVLGKKSRWSCREYRSVTGSDAADPARILSLARASWRLSWSRSSSRSPHALSASLRSSRCVLAQISLLDPDRQLRPGHCHAASAERSDQERGHACRSAAC